MNNASVVAQGVMDNVVPGRFCGMLPSPGRRAVVSHLRVLHTFDDFCDVMMDTPTSCYILPTPFPRKDKDSNGMPWPLGVAPRGLQG